MNWTEKRASRLSRMADEENMDVVGAPATPESFDHTPLTFGKYKGRTPSEVSEYDPEYIVWMWTAIKLRHCSEALFKDCDNEVRANREEGDSQDDVMDTYTKFNPR